MAGAPNARTLVSTALGSALAVAVAVSLGLGDRTAPQRSATADRADGAQAGTTALNASPVALTTFDSCSAVLDRYRATALPLVGPHGLTGSPRPAVDGVMPVTADAPDRATATPPGAERGAASYSAATSASGTTVQVAGVDEADLAKRVGDLLLVLHTGPVSGATTLNLLRTHGPGEPATEIGRFAPGWSPTGLLVDGDMVLLIGDGGAALPDGAPFPALPAFPGRRTRIDQLDISDPTGPRRLRSLAVDGSAAGVRMVDGVVRMALTSTPSLILDGTAGDPERSTEHNRGVVEDSTIDDWVPHYDLSEPDGTQSSGRLVDCADIAVPADPAGVATLTLLTVDLRADGLGGRRSTAVVASGSLLYATRDHTYVATPIGPARDPNARTATLIAGRGRTAVHLFDTSGRDAGRYLASGWVQGTLLNQFAMDEYDGVLRVASTDSAVGGIPVEPLRAPAGGPAAVTVPDTAAPPPATPNVPQSRVTVLRLQGLRLVEVGRVDGLGAGERIYAVRFAGRIGYVVTFRRTDPLYTLDLSNPTSPKTLGQLKIHGYSAYLQPVGENLLLGLGQDATDSGRVTGLQLSLFDVADLADPRRIARVRLPGAYSDAEADHHAFTLADGLVLIPFQRTTSDASPSFDTGVLAVPLTDRDGFGEAVVLRARARGPVTIPRTAPEEQTAAGYLDVPQRTVVADGAIWTLTAAGVATHDAATLDRVGYTPLS